MKLDTVKSIYRALNRKNFGGVLTQPVLKFSRTRLSHAKYNGVTMEFNLDDTKGFAAVTELVFHEMIHQYIDEFLKFENYDDHGKEFKKQYNKFSSSIVMDKEYSYANEA